MAAIPSPHSESTLTGCFLDFLARDIAQNPQNIQAISSDWVALIRSLVADVEIDLDAPLSDEDE
jgi:antitoxin PrlF